MPATCTNLGTTGSGTDASSYNTASFNFVAGRLYVLGVACMKSSQTKVPTVTGASQTWRKLWSEQVSSFSRLTVFACMPTSNQSGALTIDFDSETQLRCGWSLQELAGDVQTLGTNGFGAIGQVRKNSSASANSLTVNLASFTQADNGTLGFIMHNATSPGVTHGSGFTEMGEAAIESLGIQAQFKNSNDQTVDWSVSETNQVIGIALEINTVGAVAIPAAVSAAPTSNGASASFATHHDLATATASNNTGGDSINIALIEASTVSNQYVGISRGGMIFDTSILGNTRNPLSGHLEIYVEGKTDQLGGSGEIALVDFHPAADNTIATSDFTDGVEMGTTKQATNLTIAGITAAAHNRWVLDSTGIGNINKNDNSRFALRVEKDRANSAPTWGSSQLSRIYGHFGSAATNKPFLQLAYEEVAAANAGFLMNFM